MVMEISINSFFFLFFGKTRTVGNKQKHKSDTHKCKLLAALYFPRNVAGQGFLVLIFSVRLRFLIIVRTSENFEVIVQTANLGLSLKRLQKQQKHEFF